MAADLCVYSPLCFRDIFRFRLRYCYFSVVCLLLNLLFEFLQLPIFLLWYPLVHCLISFWRCLWYLLRILIVAPIYNRWMECIFWCFKIFLIREEVFLQENQRTYKWKLLIKQGIRGGMSSREHFFGILWLLVSPLKHCSLILNIDRVEIQTIRKYISRISRVRYRRLRLLSLIGCVSCSLLFAAAS